MDDAAKVDAPSVAVAAADAAATASTAASVNPAAIASGGSAGRAEERDLRARRELEIGTLVDDVAARGVDAEEAPPTRATRATRVGGQTPQSVVGGIVRSSREARERSREGRSASLVARGALTRAPSSTSGPSPVRREEQSTRRQNFIGAREAFFPS
jgi:hypothetical protein